VAIKSFQKNSNILVLYGDVPLTLSSTLKQIIKFRKDEINILCFNKEEQNNYGKVILGTNGLVDEIIEQKELKRKENFYLCNSGIFSIHSTLLTKLMPKINNKNMKKEYYLTDIFKMASNSDIKIKSVITSEKEVQGINDKKDLAMAESEFQENLRAKHLKAGVTMHDPSTVYLSKDTKIGKDVTIHPFVVIGKNVKISNGAEIYSFSHLEDCKIGKKTSIGPYARIRPGTQINDQAKIGNFVEVKNSTIDTNSKINHLSYVGDSIIGKNVNVGAGTITCNYDGRAKYKTVIKDNAFIGSNSSLVAPLEIGKNAYIGSGSAISKNVREKALGIERTNQIEIKNWYRKMKKR
jgi:bifunctional UDP-N-acetylglucosamine pyrophosphorylase/glucosamine-1-phosphate N-acetyltransferase